MTCWPASIAMQTSVMHFVRFRPDRNANSQHSEFKVRVNSMISQPTHSFRWMFLLTIVVAVSSFAVIALLIDIFERKQEARTPFVKVVDVTEVSTDPEPWGLNFPLQYESYKRSVDFEHTEYG